jgi:hypothetical protein
MPRAIDDIDGYEFYVYPNDHPPPHVHVYAAAEQARFSLVSIEMLPKAEMARRHAKKASKLIKINLEALKKAWNEQEGNEQV